jgi:hypothetical protein
VYFSNTFLKIKAVFFCFETAKNFAMQCIIIIEIRRGADKSLAFPICSTNETIFLSWIKEVSTTKS